MVPDVHEVDRREIDKKRKSGADGRSYEWSLPDDDMVKTAVCKGFILTMLGFSPTPQKQSSLLSRNRMFVPGRVLVVGTPRAPRTACMQLKTTQTGTIPSGTTTAIGMPEIGSTCQMINHQDDAPLPADPENKECCRETFRKVLQDINIGFSTVG